MKTPTNPEITSLDALRARAEAALQDQSQPRIRSRGSAADRYELQVHEVELRMQNEALRELHVELSLARERYRELFDRAPVPYLVLDRASTIVKANAAAAGLLQLNRSQLLGRKLSSFIEPDCSERFVRHMRATLAGDDAQSAELRMALATGASREVRLESARNPLDPQEWRVAVIDLTAARHLQDQLERSRRLEAIGTFTSGIAHDFSGVLAIVVGGTDLALEQSETGGDPVLPIRRVKRAALQAQAMVRQLLRFASGPSAESATSYALDAVIRGAEAPLRELVGPSVDLQLDLRAQGAEVGLDLGGPEEILFNLSSNAAQAMPEGGHLRIATQIVDAHVGLDPRATIRRYVRLDVKDDGVGMDEATKRHAFEPFFTTKPKGKGTGLGLAMVHGIVKRAGGHVQLTSERGKGTTFELYLPLVDAVPRRNGNGSGSSDDDDTRG